jgi:hypothetical protein
MTNSCPYIVSTDDGTNYCRLAEQGAFGLRDKNGQRIEVSGVNLNSYTVGKAKPIQSWGQGHTLVNTSTPMDELRTASAEARLGGRLWERMEDAGRRELADNPMAEQAEFYEAMIREVAAWLRSEYPGREGYGTAWANLLEQEANRSTDEGTNYCQLAEQGAKSPTAPAPLEVPKELIRKWINHNGKMNERNERYSTDWEMVITDAARWGQRQGANGIADELKNRLEQG